MSNWSAASSGAGRASQPPVRILIGAPAGMAGKLAEAFQMDSRFQIVGRPGDGQTLRDNMAQLEPEALLVDATLFADIRDLKNFITSAACAFYILYPDTLEAIEAERPEIRSERDAIAALRHFKCHYIGYPAMNELMGRISGDMDILRASTASPAERAWGSLAQGSTSGLRVISVWNRAGGTGKSTVAVALAREAVRRGFKTLLVGLGAPDSLAVVAGLAMDPNICVWLSRPNKEGLAASIQTTDGLDVITGLKESEKEGELCAAPSGREQDTSISKLVNTAAYNGYTVIILDTPVSGCAPNAISAANFLLLVSRPTLADIFATVDAFNLVTTRMSSQHNIAPGNIHLALNGMRSSLLNVKEYQNISFAAWKRRLEDNPSSKAPASMPAVSVVLPDSEAIPAAANNNGRSPLAVNDDYARGMARLGDALLGGIRQVPDSGRESSVFNVFGIKIRKT